jgi:hypothetical protein
MRSAVAPQGRRWTNPTISAIKLLIIKHLCFCVCAAIPPSPSQHSGKGRWFCPIRIPVLSLTAPTLRLRARLALSRRARAGTIRKLARGLYDTPRTDTDLGPLAPSTDDVANALRDRDGARLQAAGAHAAHLLGLSDQVPVRAVFLTDGRSRTARLGRRQIVLKHTTPKQMATAGRTSGTVIQALRWLGKRHVTSDTIAALRRRLSDADRQQLLQDIRYAPAWIANVIRSVASSQQV